jgi:hypothetical protein
VILGALVAGRYFAPDCAVAFATDGQRLISGGTIIRRAALHAPSDVVGSSVELNRLKIGARFFKKEFDIDRPFAG